jgi:hypothetical protein
MTQSNLPLSLSQEAGVFNKSDFSESAQTSGRAQPEPEHRHSVLLPPTHCPSSHYHRLLEKLMTSGLALCNRFQQVLTRSGGLTAITKVSRPKEAL